MSKFIRLSLATLIIAVASVVAFGQATTTGAIGGSVSDPNGAVVPNAEVTATNTGTNKTATAQTDGEGRFRISNLQPGSYSVAIKASGFGDYSATDVVVEVGQVVNLDAAMSVGGGGPAIVNVTTQQTVNVDNNTSATNINQTSISELPINGRRWSNFAILAPGTTPDGQFGLISFRGISGLLNNNTVDGGDNNQAFFSEERGRTRISYSISQSAIREFQLNTSNYSAEYGRAAGGVTNAVTKSGTNEFHGDAFYYQRNNKWGARNSLAFLSVLQGGVSTPVPIKPTDVRHQFGGTIGGPIAKDKVFFFFSYDEQRRNFPGLGVFSSPGFLNTVQRPTLMLPRINLTNAQIDQAIAFLNNETGQVPRRGDQRLFFPKIDWQINDSSLFTVSYNNLRWKSPAGIQTQRTNTLGRSSFGDDFVKVDSLQMRLATTFSPTVVNEFRFQWGRDFEYEFSQPPLAGEPLTGINGSAPDVFITGGIEFGKPTFLERAQYPNEKRLQFTDNISWTRGSHNFKFGTDITPVKDVLDNLRNESGAYSYPNINDFIIDFANWKSGNTLPATTQCFTANGTAGATPQRFRGRCYTGNFNQGFGPRAFEVKTTDIAFYIQDDWHASSRLTVNMGLRWEYEKTPTPFLASTNTSAVPNTGLTVAQATALHPSDKNNFGPRIGLAYAITADGKTSIRAGYGIYFGRIQNSTILNTLINTSNPGGQVQSSTPSTITVGGIVQDNPAAPIFPNTLVSAPAGTAAIQYFAPNFSQPEIHEGDVVLEREIAKNTVISGSFLFSLGRKLPTFLDRNLNAPNLVRTYNVVGGPFGGQSFTGLVYQTPRPNTAFNQMTEVASVVKSEYTAFVLQANRRFTDGLQFQVSYTRSHATDANQNSATFTQGNSPLSVYDLKAENGISNLDVPHKFVASVVWAPTPYANDSNSIGRYLLNGWTIAPIYQFYTGRPYDATISGSIAGGTGGVNGSTGSTRFPFIPRNFFRQPNIWDVDLRLSRRFSITENVKVEFLADFFNIFNHTIVTGVNGAAYAISNGTGTNPPVTLTFNTNPNTFQVVNATSSTLFSERQIQFAARFQF
jgi:hypothetical protein